ncbi:MAG TPA: hypothetical protein PK843_05795 [bacterium]|nr:hypothetical protein [bacterium]
MKHIRPITCLVFIITLLAVIAAGTAILSHQGPGPYNYESIRGELIKIHGQGLYQHMSADVAIQGIAQDYVTLCIAVPLLLISLFLARRGSRKALFVLSGTLGYFLLTYLFYTAMAMYNAMFLAYVFLLGASFISFILVLFSYDVTNCKAWFASENQLRNAGIFLITNASLISMLWLRIVLPPLFDGSIIPPEVQHYTTLVVQGFDLGLFLPMAFVVGILALRRNAYGYLFTVIYTLFLALLMTALTAKILFMARTGAPVSPAIFIIPTINGIAVLFSVALLRNVTAR